MERRVKRQCSRIRLSGTVNGVKYRIGVPNPFNRRRNPTPLDARHLPVLHALLRFVDAAHPEKQFEISDAEFTGSLPNENAWLLLVDLLTCWVRTRTGGTTIDSHFATVSFCKHQERMTAFVSLSEHIIPVLRSGINSAPESR